MKFTEKCFIRKNNSRLYKQLHRLGLHQNCFDDNSGEWLAVNYGMFISVSEGFEKLHPRDIDCGTDEEMFLALAALNDTNDYMQWFVNQSGPMRTWYLSSLHNTREQLKGTDIRKATAEEIVEHFKEMRRWPIN